MNVRDIIIKYLKANGFDGLYCEHLECSCDLNDLIPCEYDCIASCQPGYKTQCNPETCPVGGECDWHIESKR